MSSVFRAVHIESGNQVAVKILPRSLAKNSTMLQRFLREAQSAEALEHPNIVSIYDRGVDQGRYYLVLEFVEGGDLHDRVRNDGPLDIGDAVAVVRSVAAGLKYASERGLIHRDIKPANLLLSPTGEVKIIDLGLALNAEAEDERVTRDGTTVGTVDYMAPEQARDSRATSERSDIYSLGCTFYFLLTGGPPFAGGDIADKLRRHCTLPAPDPCESRPTIPKPLGALIRKMMAKRPENRFQNYGELLAALRAGPLAELGAGTKLGPAHGVEDSESEIALAPIESGITEAVGAGKSRGGDTGGGASHGPSLDLADLDEDEAVSAPPARRPGKATPHSGKAPAPPPPDDDPADLLGEEGEDVGEGAYDDELVEDLGPARSAAALPSAGQPAMMKWVYAGIGGTIALLILIFLVNLLLPSRKPDAPPKAPEEITEAPVAPEPEPQPQPAPPPVAVAAAQPPPAPAPAKVQQTPAPARPAVPAATNSGAAAPAPTAKAATPPAPAAGPTWIEPADPVAERVPETAVASDVAARFPLPAWAKSEVPTQVPGFALKVRRITDPTRPEERPSLALAFESIGSGTIEVIDDGPLADSDFRLRGDVRLLRAGAGRRPIIRLEHPRIDIIKNQGAIFLVEGKNLILDGLDLIADLQDLPREHTALFWCKGGSLTLNNCTITIINPQNYPMTVIRATGTDRPAQVRVENCFFRGAARSMVEFTGGVAEVAVVRSVLAGGQGPLVVSTTTTNGGERKLHVQRSVVASRGAFLELNSPVGSRPTPVTVRALASSFARFRTEEPTSLIYFRDDLGGEAKDVVNWQGEQNVFMGWSDWASMGSGHAVKVAGMAAARTTWPGTDALSQELPGPWPMPPDLTRVLPEQMRTLASHSLATLVGVPPPSAYLAEKTTEEFKRPEIPNFVSPIPNEVQPGQVFNPGANPAPFNPPVFNPNPPGAAPNPADPNAPPAVKELLFDVTAKQWQGNLGAYLHDQLKPGDRRVKVRISGTGRFYVTPVRIPDGISLEIVVETARQAGGVPPEWIISPRAAGEALIDVKGGDLVMTGVEMVRDGGARVKALIRTEDAHLVVNHCRFRVDPKMPGAQKGGGNLIVFRAPTTRPLPDQPWPFDKPFDKPVCRIIDSVLITPGDVLTADVGRGMIALTQCAIGAGNAFVLEPAKVARSRFDADLSLERCTIAAEKSFVTLGAWPGTTPGPDRPWLVTSRDTAYMSSYTPPSRESVLLKVEPNSLAQGTLFWQGINDAYEVQNFTARTDKPLVQNAHPDVFRHWVSMWGGNHFRLPGGRVPSVVKLQNRPRAGNVTPGDLALDPDDHPGRTELNVGADLNRLQVTPGAESPAAGGPRRKRPQ
jgi:serine/threonine-protein kinase